MKIKLSSIRRIVREELTRLAEVDTDPSNNPGRPADAYEYLGMRPRPEMAMAHPSLGGGSGDASGAAGSVGMDGGESPELPDGEEPTEEK